MTPCYREHCDGSVVGRYEIAGDGSHFIVYVCNLCGRGHERRDEKDLYAQLKEASAREALSYLEFILSMNMIDRAKYREIKEKLKL